MLMTMVIMAISMVMIDDNDVDNKFDDGESEVKVMVVMNLLIVMEVMIHDDDVSGGGGPGVR